VKGLTVPQAHDRQKKIRGVGRLFRAIRNRIIFGKPIYVWKARVPDKPGVVTLGFTEDRRGSPLFDEERGWSRFEEPSVFPFGFESDPDYINFGHNRWCRVEVGIMIMEVRRKGFYIAPPRSLHLLEFSTVQEFPEQDGSGAYPVTRWGYIWADEDPEVLPREIEQRPALAPWRVTRKLDIGNNWDREWCRFWHIQRDLNMFRCHIKPYAPERIETEEDKQKAQEERLAALKQEERQRIANNELRKTQWPYKSWWWPKNTFQKSAFVSVSAFIWLFLSVLSGVVVRNDTAALTVSIILSAVLFAAILSALSFNPFAEITPLPIPEPEPAPPLDPSFRQRLQARCTQK
jgi:hypothetical protein